MCQMERQMDGEESDPYAVLFFNLNGATKKQYSSERKWDQQ